MRAFVAVWPTPEVSFRLAAIERPLLLGIRWTTEEQWHVTLRFLGQLDDSEVELVKASLVGLSSSFGGSPVTAVAGPGLEVLGRSILCVPVGGLDSLSVAVGAATAGIGAPAGERRFRGHLTIARASRGMRLSAPAPSSVPFFATWPVDEVTLVASTLHSAGARYHVVERYRLPTSA